MEKQYEENVDENLIVDRKILKQTVEIEEKWYICDAWRGRWYFCGFDHVVNISSVQIDNHLISLYNINVFSRG